MKKAIAAFVMGFGLSACVSLPLPRVETTTLDPANSPSLICVLVPPDASFVGERYPGSGHAIASVVRQALRQIDRPSLQVSQLDSNAHRMCAERGARIFLQTTVLHYEDRATGLFGKPDQIELKLSLYSLEDAEIRRSVVFQAKTNLLRSALLEWGNAKPAALLGESFDQAVWSLMQQRTVPGTHADSFGLD